MNKVELNSDMLFKQLSDRLKGKPDITARILAHVRAVSPHTTLVAFHNNGATEEEKVSVYKDCLMAVLKADFSGLKGEVPKGQAQAPQNVAPATRLEKPTSYMVGCKSKGDSTWSHNQCRFASKEQAELYAKDLASRWMGLETWEVQPSQDPVTHAWEPDMGLVDLALKPKSEEAPPQIPPVKPEIKEDTSVTATALAAPVDPKVAAVLAALTALQAPAQPALDEKAIRAIVEKVLAETVGKLVATEVAALKSKLVEALT